MKWTKDVPRFSFIRIVTPHMSVLPLCPTHLPKALSPMPTTWLWRFQYLNLKGEINSQSKYFILAPPRPNILLKSKLPPNRLKGNGPACKFCWTGFGTLWFQGVQTPCLCWVPIMLGWAVFLNLRHLRNGMPVCEGSVSLPSWESMGHTSQSLLLSYSTLSNPLTSSPHLYSFEKNYSMHV